MDPLEWNTYFSPFHMSIWESRNPSYENLVIPEDDPCLAARWFIWTLITNCDSQLKNSLFERVFLNSNKREMKEKFWLR